MDTTTAGKKPFSHAFRRLFWGKGVRADKKPATGRPAADRASNRTEAWRLVFEHVEANPLELYRLGRTCKTFATFCAHNDRWAAYSPLEALGHTVDSSVAQAAQRNRSLHALPTPPVPLAPGALQAAFVARQRELAQAAERLPAAAKARAVLTRLWRQPMHNVPCVPRALSEDSWDAVRNNPRNYDLARMHAEVPDGPAPLLPMAQAMQLEPTILAVIWGRRGTYAGATAPLLLQTA